MKCFICGDESKNVLPSGDYTQLACPGCGEYKISGTAVHAVQSKKLIFDIQRSRDWLNSFLGSGQIPKIDEDKARGLQKL